MVSLILKKKKEKKKSLLIWLLSFVLFCASAKQPCGQKRTWAGPKLEFISSFPDNKFHIVHLRICCEILGIQLHIKMIEYKYICSPRV